MPHINQNEMQGQVDPQFFIAKYLVPVLEKKRTVLICTIIGFVIALPVSFMIKPEYSSTTITQLETPRAQMISKVTEQIASSKGDQAYIMAAVERMHSSTFKTEVLKIIPERLQKDLETPLSITGQLKAKFVSSPPSQETISPENLMKLSSRIEIKGDNRKGTIQITGTTFAQDLATVLVQSYIDVWVAMNMENNKRVIRHELEFTKSQRDDYFQKFNEAEQALRSFKQTYEIPPALSSVTDMELQSQLDALQSKVENAKDRYKRIDDIFLDLSRKEKSVINNIKILNPPQVPLYPSKNDRLLIIFIGLFIGAAVGIVPILAWDYYRGNIRHKKDILNAVDIPIIGSLPPIK